ncbi:MAG: hypothetical protein KDD82_30305 [Planctomycetes bacterium]|nr:hypothetical protein [Planctomycetota bacterium]
MSDDRVRELERAWRASPNDPALLQALLAARRRAGLTTPPALLEAQVFPPRRFESAHRYEVFVRDAEGRVLALGETSRARPAVELPAHRAWWVRPHAGSRHRTLWEDLREQAVPGLSLERLRPGSLEWRWLGELHGLRWLSLEDVRLVPRLLEEVAKLEGLTHLNLRRSKPSSPLDGVDDALAACVARLPRLTHLDLAGSQALTRAGLLEVATGASPLHSLDLSACPALERDALQTLSGSPALSRLVLRDNPGFDHTALRRLARLHGLSELDLTGVAPLDRFALGALEELPLVRLALGDVSDHEHPSALLRRLPTEHLTHLKLRCTRRPFTLNLSELSALRQLEELDLEGVALGQSWFAREAPSFPRLRGLSAHETVSLDFGALARACPRLERLRIEEGRCWEEDLEALAELPLRELSLRVAGAEQSRARGTALPELPPRSDAERAAVHARLRGLPPCGPAWAFTPATCFGPPG